MHGSTYLKIATRERGNCIINFGYVFTWRFCKGMDRDQDYWTSDKCNSKWNLVNKLVTQWNGIYANFENQWASRESEASLLKKKHMWHSKMTCYTFLSSFMYGKLSKEVLIRKSLQHMKTLLIRQKEAEHLHIRVHKNVIGWSHRRWRHWRNTSVSSSHGKYKAKVWAKGKKKSDIVNFIGRNRVVK